MLLCDGDIHGHQNSSRRVDGHGGADFIKGNTIKKGFHIPEGVYGDTNLTHFPHGHFMVRIVTYLCWQVEGHRQSCLTLFHQKFIAPVGFLSIGKSGILTHGPMSSPVHSGLNPSGIRVFPGKTKVRKIINIPIV